jgi:DNA replication and repair protein RecF
LWGENGAGKTNLLEAIHLLAVGRSHRTLNDRELVSVGSDAVRVRGVGESAVEGAVDVEVGFRAGEPKRAWVNGKEEGRLSSIVGRLGAVMVAPEDLEIPRGAPERRRRFLDQLLCQMRPAHMAALQAYGKALRQRNRALREARDGMGSMGVSDEGAADGARGPAAVAAAWDAPLVDWGARVRAGRASLVRRLAALAADRYREVSGRDESLEVGYPAGDSREDLAAAVARAAPAEARRGTTLVGPHRDDLALALDGKDLRAYGSRGQQRAAAFALRLAAAAIFREERGEAPVLLLDDVFAELDAGRADRLAALVAGTAQVFATATHAEDLRGRFPGVPLYRVRPGRIERMEG